MSASIDAQLGRASGGAWTKVHGRRRDGGPRRGSAVRRKILIFMAASTWFAAMATAAAAQEIVLGYLPGTGEPLAISRTNFIAAQMAVDAINAGGGIEGKKVRIASFESAGKPEQLQVGLGKLAEDDKVLAIIGPFSSSDCREVFPAGERLGIATMSMASSPPDLSESFTYAFRNTSDEAYLFARVMRALKEKSYPTATGAIAYAADDAISKRMGEEVLPSLMRSAGTEIKLSVTYQAMAFDLAPQAAQLAAQVTDLIGVGSGPEPAARLVQELRRQGHKGRLVAGSAIADPDLPRMVGAAGDGTTAATTYYPSLDETTRTFEAEFLRRAKAAGIDRAAAPFDAATYDVVLMYAQAIKSAKATGDRAKLAAERAAVRDALRKLKDFPGLEGLMSMGKNGDTVKPVYVIEMQDGKWGLLASYPAELDAAR
jgi:branched-chain amino acid transport system substrate-binding protein